MISVPEHQARYYKYKYVVDALIELEDESGAKNVDVIKSHEEKVDLSRLG